MDETRQPGGEPTRVNGNGTGGGAGTPHPTSWQLTSENGSRRPEPTSPSNGLDASGLDTRGSGHLRTAEANWSAAGAALETGGFGAHWRSPLANGQRGRASRYPPPNPSPEYAELLAPISPPVATPASAPPYPYEGDLEQTTEQARPPQASTRLPQASSQPRQASTGADPGRDYPPYPVGRSVLDDPTLDDLPAIGQAAAASRVAARAGTQDGAGYDTQAPGATGPARPRSGQAPGTGGQTMPGTAEQLAALPIAPRPDPPAPLAPRQSGERRPGQWQSGERQSGEWQSGEWQIGERGVPQARLATAPVSPGPAGVPPATASRPAAYGAPQEGTPQPAFGAPRPPAHGAPREAAPPPPYRGPQEAAPQPGPAPAPRAPGGHGQPELPPRRPGQPAGDQLPRQRGPMPPEEAARAAQGAQAARVAADMVRAAQRQAVVEDHAAVEAAYAAAVDAREQRPTWRHSAPREGMPSQERAPAEGTSRSALSAEGETPQRPTAVTGGALPQRVPAAPDVPDVPDDGPEDDFVEQERPPPLPSELARIATHLRDDEDTGRQPRRPDGFDMEAVLVAVREVEGVRDAQLRPNPNGVHTLRLDLSEGADGARVSREVARLLKQRMGLAAEPRRPSVNGPGQRGGPAGGPAQPVDPAAARGTGAPTVGDAMPVAGAAPALRIPIPAAAAEQLGGPAAVNAQATGRAIDERGREPLRRHAATSMRGRNALDGRTGEHPQIPAARRGKPDGSRVMLDQVQVSTLGLDATVEVRMISGTGPAFGVASGPAVDGYVLRLAAVAAANAIDQLLSRVDAWEQPGRCFVEHAAVVPLGSSEVAVVVVLLVCGGWVEQLTGSALVSGDPRQAIVRATLAAVNRRLDGLLG